MSDPDVVSKSRYCALSYSYVMCFCISFSCAFVKFIFCVFVTFLIDALRFHNTTAIFLKQDSAFSSDMNATDDIDIAILSVRLSVSDSPELYQNG